MAALGCPHVSSPPPAPTEQVTRSQAPASSMHTDLSMCVERCAVRALNHDYVGECQGAMIARSRTCKIRLAMPPGWPWDRPTQKRHSRAAVLSRTAGEVHDLKENERLLETFLGGMLPRLAVGSVAPQSKLRCYQSEHARGARDWPKGRARATTMACCLSETVKSTRLVLN